MPAAYAHMTLVNILREPRRLENLSDFPRNAIPILSRWQKFCELGAVSPDYPYLALDDPQAKKWADLMHWIRVGEMIKAGIIYLRGVSGEGREKGLAWLLGYCAHVTTDVTVHPVIELKVGPYVGNERRHRICEMNQDVYIFQRLNLKVTLSEFLKSGIYRCADPADAEKLDPDVSKLWLDMLKKVHAAEFTGNLPDIHKWHRRFTTIVDNIAEESNRLVAFARHVASGVLGMMYPLEHEIDLQYINNLLCPGGRTHSYDQVFDMALANVGQVWTWVASGVLAGDTTYESKIGNWNLDTGLDENRRSVFWS